jgi:DoxX-like family
MTTSTMTKSQLISSAAVWTGRILQLLLILLLLFDAGTKVLRLDFVVKATVEAGYPPTAVAPIGWTLLLSLIIYAIPRTAILGAILLTGYLGGAIATNVHQASSLGFDLFPAIIGVLAWVALYLRDPRLRAMIPLPRDE